MKNALTLPNFVQWTDHSVLILRLVVGSFLIWGVLDNILSAERMIEFENFLIQFGFPLPDLMARVSVWAQFLIGVSFVSGIFIRWAGIFCVINFIVAIVMVDSISGIRASFPSASLICIGLFFMSYGAGRFSLETLLIKSE